MQCPPSHDLFFHGCSLVKVKFISCANTSLSYTCFQLSISTLTSQSINSGCRFRLNHILQFYKFLLYLNSVTFPWWILNTASCKHSNGPASWHQCTGIGRHHRMAGKDFRRVLVSTSSTVMERNSSPKAYLGKWEKQPSHWEMQAIPNNGISSWFLWPLSLVHFPR